ncbi:hypothetical protein CA833_00865 [Novosphingobium sp. KA1]|nr:hypothetical protein CA833_00865 [Novosphingobium sp. KA1]
MGTEYATIGDAMNAWFAHTTEWPDATEQALLKSRVRRQGGPETLHREIKARHASDEALRAEIDALFDEDEITVPPAAIGKAGIDNLTIDTAPLLTVALNSAEAARRICEAYETASVVSKAVIDNLVIEGGNTISGFGLTDKALAEAVGDYLRKTGSPVIVQSNAGMELLVAKVERLEEQKQAVLDYLAGRADGWLGLDSLVIEKVRSLLK